MTLPERASLKIGQVKSATAAPGIGRLRVRGATGRSGLQARLIHGKTKLKIGLGFNYLGEMHGKMQPSTNPDGLTWKEVFEQGIPSTTGLVRGSNGEIIRAGAAVGAQSR
mmetsp:Transcript_108984/g.199685  ORF Transcript_108984/g.199685 Transcript_108984/m.199685 type:complete len:110 (-) Transcript_108984:69-398(-)